jgi:hypothetical protein
MDSEGFSLHRILFSLSKTKHETIVRIGDGLITHVFYHYPLLPIEQPGDYHIAMHYS